MGIGDPSDFFDDRAPVIDAPSQQDIEKKEFNDRNEGLFKEAIEGNDLDIIKDFHSKGMDLEMQDNYAIRWASCNGYKDIVKYLCDNGVDVTIDDNRSIKLAGTIGHFDVVSILVKYGADIGALFEYNLLEYKEYKKTVKESSFVKEVSSTDKKINAIKARKIKRIKGLKI